MIVPAPVYETAQRVQGIGPSDSGTVIGRARGRYADDQFSGKSGVSGKLSAGLKPEQALPCYHIYYYVENRV